MLVSLILIQCGRAADPDAIPRIRQEPVIIKGEGTGIGSVAFSPNGKVLAIETLQKGGDLLHTSNIILWDTAEKKRQLTLHVPYFVTSVDFAPNGKILAIGGVKHGGWLTVGVVTLWDAGTGKKRTTFAVEDLMQLFSAAFSPDSKRLAVAGPGQFSINEAQGTVYAEDIIGIWEVATGKEQMTLHGGGNRAKHLFVAAFTKDSATLISGDGDGVITLWDLASGKVRATLEGHTKGEAIVKLTLLPDGRRLVSVSSDGAIKVWDLVTRKEQATLQGPAARLNGQAVSPDGRVLAIGAQDGSITLLDLANKAPAQRFKAHDKAVRALAFAPDGRTLASASYDNTVKLWPIVPAKKTGPGGKGD